MSNFAAPATSSPPPPSLLCEITRAAKVSWCPSPQHPTLLAAGSTGTIDDSFETRSSLELYELSLASSAAPSPPLLLGALTTKDYFYSVAWGMKGINAEFSHGLIAGGMSDGAVNIWNAGAIISKAPASSPPTPSAASAPSSSTASASLLSRSTQQHSGAVKALQFHPTQPNLLASGGNDGVVLVWDLQDVRQPRASKPNPALAGHEQQPITCLGWNKKVPQILASSSDSGETTVWDLRQKKSILKFRSSSRTGANVSSTALVWNPEASVQLAVVYSSYPVAEIWDLRQSMTPKTKLEGFHANSVLGCDWCPHDARLLLTTGDDNRMGVWDPIDGQLLAEYAGSSGVANWDVVWSPNVRNLFATSSFDAYARVSVHSLPAAGQHVPTWMKRPSGGAFAFGGKFVSVAPAAAAAEPAAHPAQPAAATSSVPLASAVSVSTLSLEPQLLALAEQFQQVLLSGDFVSFCDYKKQQAAERGAEGEEERVTWTFMKILFEEERSQRFLLLRELGFEPPKGSELFHLQQQQQGSKQQQPDHQPRHDAASAAPPATAAPPAVELIPEDQFFNQDFGGSDALSGASAASVPVVAAEEKNGVEPYQDTVEGVNHSATDSKEGKAASSAASAPGRPQLAHDELCFRSFSVGDDDESEIRHALIYGDFSSAVSRCLQTGRLADAIIFSSFGPASLWEETRSHYFAVHPHPFIRSVMKNVSSSQLEEMVAASSLSAAPASGPSSSSSSWKETLAMLITYTTTDRYRSLVNQLAERLEAAGQSLPALICFMCSSNVDRAVELFSRQSSGGSPSSPTLQLHAAMEKIAVFAQATSAHLQPSTPLLSLKYAEYATLLAEQGFIVGAWNYLRVSNPSGSDPSSQLLLDRLYQASYATEQPIQQPPPPFPFHPVANVQVDAALPSVENQYEMSKRSRQMLVSHTQQPPQQQQQHPHAQPTAGGGPGGSQPSAHPGAYGTHGGQPQPQQPQQHTAQPGQFGMRAPPPQQQQQQPQYQQQAQPQYAQQQQQPQQPPYPGQPQQQPQYAGAHPPTPYPPPVAGAAASAYGALAHAGQYGGQQPPHQQQGAPPPQQFPGQRPGPGSHPPPPSYPQQPYGAPPPQQPQPTPGYPQSQPSQPPHPQQQQPPYPGQPQQQQQQYPQPPQPQPHLPMQLQHQQQHPSPPSHPGQLPHHGAGGPAPYPPQPQHPQQQQQQQQPYPPQQQQPMQPPQMPQPRTGQQQQPGYPQTASPALAPYGQPPQQHAAQHPSMPSMPPPSTPAAPPQQAYDGYGQHQQTAAPPATPSQPRIFNPAGAHPPQTATAASVPSPYTAQPPAPLPPAAAAPPPPSSFSSAPPPSADLSSLSFAPEHQQLVSILESHYSQLAASAAPSDQRKIAELHHRLLSLYTKLALPQSASLSPSLTGELTAFCQALTQADYASCKRHHTNIVKNDWTGNNDWILALKSFLDLLKKYLWTAR